MTQPFLVHLMVLPPKYAFQKALNSKRFRLTHQDDVELVCHVTVFEHHLLFLVTLHGAHKTGLKAVFICNLQKAGGLGSGHVPSFPLQALRVDDTHSSMILDFH